MWKRESDFRMKQEKVNDGNINSLSCKVIQTMLIKCCSDQQRRTVVSVSCVNYVCDHSYHLWASNLPVSWNLVLYDTAVVLPGHCTQCWCCITNASALSLHCSTSCGILISRSTFICVSLFICRLSVCAHGSMFRFP